MDSQPPRPPPSRTAGLNQILNNDDQPAAPARPSAQQQQQFRDSGFYSTAEPSSKHTSAASFNGHGLSPSTSGYSSQDKTPSPTSAHAAHPQVSPHGNGMSVASMVSQAGPAESDPRRLERPQSIESNGYGASAHMQGANAPGLLRRESVDSTRINQGMSSMAINNSPYGSTNHSTTSIRDTLQLQRNPRSAVDPIHRISNGYQPNAARNPDLKTTRTAPTITGPATGNIARAAEPIKGQAWAFPEEDTRSSQQYDDSRRSSITESIASNLTADSRLPYGQRRFDEQGEYAPHSSTSEFPPMHHHTMQPKQLSDLQSEEGMGGAGGQPYSRTPELRVSHKLAERKRRTEMKELFDQLRDLMPQERGNKASKWEILTKAIATHQQLAVDNNHYQRALHDQGLKLDSQDRMIQDLKYELDAVRRELEARGGPRADMPPSTSHSSQHAPATPTGPQPFPQTAHHHAPANYAHPRAELPPIRHMEGPPHGSESMTGVQYDAPRSNGHRPDHHY